MKTVKNNPKKLDNNSQRMQTAYRLICKLPFMPSSAQYNLTVSHKHKFIWFRVAKVGTRTILYHFKNNKIILDVVQANYIQYPINSFKDYFKFAFIRNPWERLVSCWQDKVVRSNLYKFSNTELEEMRIFENFVEYVSNLNIEQCDRHLRLQSALIDLNNIDYLGRMETFDDDSKYIFQRLGLKDLQAKPRNITPNKKPYQEFYSQNTIMKVAKIYKKDIQIFGYQY